MARWAIAGLLVLCLALAHGKKAEEEHVVTINGDEEFSKAVKDSELLVAEFYAPWCGHCKNLAPEYEKAAKMLNEAGSTVVLAKIDATLEENKALSSKYGIQGFPTLKIFRGGKLEAPSDYAGPRDAAGIVTYMEKASAPPSKELKSAEEVEELKKKDPAVIGVFASAKSKEFKAFEGAAGTLWSDYDFGHVFDASLVPEAKKAPAVLLFKSYDEPVVALEGGALSQAAIEAFVEGGAEPSLPEMDEAPRNKKAVSRIFGDQDTPKLLAVVGEGKDAAKFREVFSRIAKERSDKFNTLWINPEKNPQVAKYFGIEDADLPAAAIHVAKGDLKYFAKHIKPKGVEAWLDDFEAGKVERHIKSEEAPKDNSGPVKIVTANTFDEIVFGGKDVLIEFYAPWCGHCKALTPIYEQLGEAFAGDDSVVIAKLDATTNDVPSDKFQVQGFPTLAWVSGKDGKVTVYQGDRSLEDLTAFVKGKGVKAAAAEDDDEEDLDADLLTKGAEAGEEEEEPAKDEL